MICLDFEKATEYSVKEESLQKFSKGEPPC